MRPILLELENFTVYRRQSVDFSDLNFFIIQGRTGAGKTSLIDAICYALYGKVPRYKGSNPQEYLISKGQRRMRVRLEFSVKGKRYVVDRLYEISRSQEVRFYEGSKPINLKVKEVEDYVSKILGMDYETFTKVIVLPQGQFDRFLKPQRPNERREILNRLLGYDEIFERMNKIIKDTLNQLKAKKDALEIEYESLKAFTPGYIANMDLKIKEIQKQIETLEKEKEVLNAKLKQALEKENLERELLEKRQRLLELLDKQKEMQQKQEKLNIAKEVSEYEQYLNEYERLKRKERELTEEERRLKDEHIKCTEELQSVEEEFRSIEEEYKNLELIRSDTERLKIQMENLKQLLEIDQKIKQIISNLEKYQATKERLEKELVDLQEKQRSVENELLQVEDQLRKLEGIEGQYERAKELKKKYDELPQIDLEAKRIESEMKKLEEKFKHLQSQREELESKLFEASIHHIAQRLSPGQLCPVCGNKVHEVPKLHKEDAWDLTQIKQELERLKTQEQELISKKASLEAQKGHLEQKKSELANYEDFYKSYAKLEEEYKTFQKLRERERELRKEHQEIMSGILKKSQDLTSISTSLEHTLKDLERQKEEKRNILEKLGRHIDDPQQEHLLIEKERREKEKKIKEVQERYEKIRNYREELRSKRLVIDERIRQNEKLKEEIRQELDKVNKALMPAMEKFGDIDKLRSLCLPKEELKKLEEEISHYKMFVERLKEEVQKLEDDLVVYPKDLDRKSIEDQLGSLENTLRQLYQEAGSLSRELQQAKEKMQRKEEIEKELTSLMRETKKYEILERDLRSNNFPEFVSRHMLQSILERASHYLFKFTSGLYEFKLVDSDKDNLYVIDRSSGYERSVLTLSGGETFLASLSLAFAVSDIVSHNAPLESMFIDEGFGSLDRETRESLGEFFELIKSNAGRMVGIISHLEDLAEKFDQKILIEKRGDQSFIKVVS